MRHEALSLSPLEEVGAEMKERRRRGHKKLPRKNSNGGEQRLTGQEVEGETYHAVEVRRVLDDGPLFLRKVRKAFTKHLTHVRRIEPEVDGVCEPADCDVEMMLSSGDVYQSPDQMRGSVSSSDV